MAKLRVMIDLAFPYPISDEFRTQLEAIGQQIREVKKLAVSVGNESTVKATYHICHNDENSPCEPEIDI